MDYKSELYENTETPAFFRSEEGEHVLMNVGMAIALTAIALSVAMIMFEHFNGTPRLAMEDGLGKSQPVADADVLLARMARLTETGNK